MTRTVDEALSELEREAQVRIRCYDRWINDGKVSRVDAWDRAERLLSSIKHLRDYADILSASHIQEGSATATEPSSAAILKMSA